MSLKLSSLFVAVAALAFATSTIGCFHPETPPCTFRCDTSGPNDAMNGNHCPDGYVCSADDHYCHLAGSTGMCTFQVADMTSGPDASIAGGDMTSPRDLTATGEMSTQPGDMSSTTDQLPSDAAPSLDSLSPDLTISPDLSNLPDLGAILDLLVAG